MKSSDDNTIARIYLDTCVYNRPFDDQTQPRIWLETLAFSVIIQMIEQQSITLLTSSVIAYENSRNPNESVRAWVWRCTRWATQHQSVNVTIRERAEDLERHGIKALDALHIACAEAAKADYFVTCDARLVRRWNQIHSALQQVLSPVDLVQVITGDEK